MHSDVCSRGVGVSIVTICAKYPLCQWTRRLAINLLLCRLSMQGNSVEGAPILQ